MKRAIVPRDELIEIGFISAALLLIEVLFGWATFVFGFSPLFLLTLHLLLFAVLFLPVIFRKSGEETFFPYVPLLFLPLGPFGALICLIFVLYYPRRLKKGKTFQEWYGSLFPKEFFIEKSALYESMLSEREDYSSKENMVPFMDIMRSGTEEQKGEAINKILSYFRPSFTQALVEGLKDKSSVIRVRAATAVARIEQDFLTNRETLEEKLRVNPQDEESLLALGKNEEDYCHTAFVGEEGKLYSLEKAIALYRSYLLLNPNEAVVQVRLINLLYEKGDLKEGLKEIEEVVSKEGIDSIEILRIYLKILFRLGEYDKIRELSRRDYPFLEVQKEEEMRLRDILLLWRYSQEEVASV